MALEEITLKGIEIFLNPVLLHLTCFSFYVICHIMNRWSLKSSRNAEVLSGKGTCKFIRLFRVLKLLYILLSV